MYLCHCAFAKKEQNYDYAKERESCIMNGMGGLAFFSSMEKGLKTRNVMKTRKRRIHWEFRGKIGDDGYWPPGPDARKKVGHTVPVPVVTIL